MIRKYNSIVLAFEFYSTEQYGHWYVNFVTLLTCNRYYVATIPLRGHWSSCVLLASAHSG